MPIVMRMARCGMCRTTIGDVASAKHANAQRDHHEQYTLVVKA